MFTKESQLVDALAHLLHSDYTSFQCARVAFEFNFQSGRADVVGISIGGEVLAFEAKLANWKEAMHQAYRNASFAHSCYVVVPFGAAKNAFRAEREFKRRGVGLCTIREFGIEVLIPACCKKPLLPWLSEDAKEFILTA